jgi:hypothetical protein
MMKLSNPDYHYREFLKKFSQCKGELGIFLKKNFGLIIKTARKRFGNSFDLDEIISDAAAAYDRMKYYHNRRKPTKHTSSYMWFLNKQFDRSSRYGVVTDKMWNGSRYSENGNDLETQNVDEAMFDRFSHESFFSSEDSSLAREEEMFYGSSLIDFQEVEEHKEDSEEMGIDVSAPGANSRKTKASPFAPKYLICFESFKGLLSTDLYMVLSALSERKMQRNRRHCEKLLETRRSVGDVSRLLRSNLYHEISRAGYRLYVAVCVNGTCNNVLVAARSEEEAKERLLPYGEMLELRMMETSFGKGNETCTTA